MYYRHNREVACRRVEDEYVLVHPRAGEILVLDEVGARIWELCGEQPMSPTALGRRLAQEFAVGERRAARDASAFLEELKSADCVEALP